MDNWSTDGAMAHKDSATIVQGAGYALMQDKGGKRQTKTFENKVDPAFDPITAALRQMHDNFASEPIPADFMDLLDRIDERFAATKKPS